MLPWLQPSSCNLWGKAASLPLHTLHSNPVSARCLLSVRLQSSTGDRRAMLKAFSVLRWWGGETSGGGFGTISLL
jgi:hypothetical protein